MSRSIGTNRNTCMCPGNFDIDFFSGLTAPTVVTDGSANLFIISPWTEDSIGGDEGNLSRCGHARSKRSHVLFCYPYLYISIRKFFLEPFTAGRFGEISTEDHDILVF